MLRKHENSDAWKAGALAILVHAVLLVAMFISINWKTAHTVLKVTEVELWDNIPASNPPAIKIEPEPVLAEKPEPKPEPKPIVEEKPKPEAPKVDIELEKNKKVLEQKKLDEQRKKEALDKIKQQTREEDLREKQAAEQKKIDEKLRKIQEEMLNENGAHDAKVASAASAGEVNEFKTKIKIKIQGNVNKTLCGDGDSELKFEIKLLPTGELSGSPRLVKSNVNEACNDAVERAIKISEPLPLPSDPALFSHFINLHITFHPND